MAKVPEHIEQRVVAVYTWVAKAYYKRIKSFEVPEAYHDAAKRIADEGNGFQFDGKRLSWG
jgi:hypothetical protein